MTKSSTGHSTNTFRALQKRAEAWIQDNERAPKHSAHTDTKELIHELYTYHIELELQNEDLRHAQQELEVSRSRYAELYDFAPIGYLTLSAKGLIIEANLAAADMLGLPRGDLLNKRFSSFIVADDQDIFYLNRRKLLDTENKQSYELRLQKQDGSVFYGQLETDANWQLCDPPGQFRVVLADISPRKEVEQDLLRVKDRYRGIVMDQHDLICRFDPKGRITFVNDAYCRCFGVRHQDILGTNFLPDIHKDDLPLVRDHFKNLTKVKPDKTIEHRVYLPNGELHWQQWCGRLLYDNEGKVIECQAVGRDITAIKNAEEQLQHEVKLRQLFMDALPCYALLVRYNSREIVAANKAARAAGAKPGRQCFTIWNKSDSPCSWCRAPALWESGEAQNEQFWAQDIYRDAYWIPAGDDLYLHYAFDITDKQKVKDALEKARHELEDRVNERTLELQKTHEQLLHSAKLAAVGKLSASIAHEFNNPLQSVMTIIKGIGQYVPMEEQEEQLVALALQECNRMKQLIANLQDFYRPTSGKVAPVDLHTTIDALLLLCKKDFKTRKIAVEKNYDATMPPIMAVADQLKQVFLNLLNNGAYACEGGGTITITTEKNGANSIIHIQDTGRGIDPADVSHIFEPFFTTKPELKGTGLGLSVSYGIIKKHGGDIAVQSKPGKGTVFSISLPVKGGCHDQ